MNRYYWEVLFNTEYFPYWEFSMLMMLCLILSILWRVHRIENKIDKWKSPKLIRTKIRKRR